MLDALHNITSLLSFTKSQLERGHGLSRIFSLFSDAWKLTFVWLLLVLLLTSVSMVALTGFFHVVPTRATVAVGGATFLLVRTADHALAAEGCAAEGSAGCCGVLVHVAVCWGVLFERISVCCYVVAEEGCGSTVLVFLVYHLGVCCTCKDLCGILL